MRMTNKVNRTCLYRRPLQGKTIKVNMPKGWSSPSSHNLRNKYKWAHRLQEDNKGWEAGAKKAKGKYHEIESGVERFTGE